MKHGPLSDLTSGVRGLQLIITDGDVPSTPKGHLEASIHPQQPVLESSRRLEQPAVSPTR